MSVAVTAMTSAHIRGQVDKLLLRDELREEEAKKKNKK